MPFARTPTPTVPFKRDLQPNNFIWHKRQDPPAEEDYPTCTWVDANVQSCYPTRDTVVYQNQWTRFIWNTRYALFVGDNDDADVLLILKNADSDQQVGNWTRPNKLGRFSLAIDDSWWDERAVQGWTGQDRNWSFYWQIIPATHVLDGGEDRQPTFTVVQTALPNSALSSSSASVISQSLVSVSRSIAQEESDSIQSAQQSRDAALQAGHDNNQFPPWAIALIVILGFVSLVSTLALVFALLRGVRRKRMIDRRSSMGSESPMMAATGAPMSPVGTTKSLVGALPSVLPQPVRHAPSVRYDAASITSRTNSAGEGVITSTDAAIMADAFRKALRKPDFADRPQEEGESPEAPGVNDNETTDLLNRELAEEGRNIRSVSSERGVKLVMDDELRR